MISLRDEQYVREKAYLPEHIVPLMTALSQAEPFLREGHLFFVKEDGMIFIGYPLEGEFREEIFTRLLEEGRKEFHPATTWFIAPRTPETLRARVRERETDDYYRLDLPLLRVKRSLEREAEKAGQVLRVEKNRAWSREHAALTQEFLEKEKLNPRVRELYLRMDRVLAHSETSLVLSAMRIDATAKTTYVATRAPTSTSSLPALQTRVFKAMDSKSYYKSSPETATRAATQRLDRLKDTASGPGSRPADEQRAEDRRRCTGRGNGNARATILFMMWR